MTDCLIVLNGENAEGFFKFENNYRYMTCALNADKPFVWVADEHLGEMQKNSKIASPVKSKPENCGIFVLRDGKAYPVLLSGNEEQIFKTVSASYVIQTSEPIADINVTNLKNTCENTVESETISDVDIKDVLSYKEESENDAVKTEFEKKEQKIPCSFWDCNEKDFLRILEENPTDEEMNMLIPGSRWAKVTDDDAEYLLGVIFNEEDMPLYLCYGFLLPWSEHAPEALDGYSQWIPKDCSDSHGDGYWVIYINAETGERVR